MGMEQEEIERYGSETVLSLYRRACLMIMDSTPFEGFHYAAHALHTLSAGGGTIWRMEASNARSYRSPAWRNWT